MIFRNGMLLIFILWANFYLGWMSYHCIIKYY